MKRIKISELPTMAAGNKYPWDEWNKLVPGEGTEVTEALGDVLPVRFQVGSAWTASRRGLKIKTQGNRAWVYRPEEE